jgi:transcriptional regulator with XRE-family HTH domain
MTESSELEQLLALAEVRDLARSGRALRIRVASGLTQAELGAAVGVDGSTVHRWERGSRRPSGARALAYGKALRVLSMP